MRGRSSLYNEAACRVWYEARCAEAEEQPVDLAHARARKELAQAKVAEQLHAQRAGELLPKAEVEKLWDGEVSRVRARILSTYTTSADRVHRAATLRGVQGVEQELKGLAYELLRELASGEPAADETPKPSPRGKTRKRAAKGRTKSRRRAA